MAFELDKGWEVLGQIEIDKRCFLYHPHLLDFHQPLLSAALYSSPSSTPKPTAPGCFPLCNHSFLPLLAQAAQLPKARPSCLPSCPSPFATSHPVGPGKRQEIRGWLGACCSEHLVIPMTLVCQGGTQASVP